MHEHGSLPEARQKGLLEEVVGEELLLYDQARHTAHCLSPIAACVWRHCDGEHDIAALAGLAEASEDLVAGALHELREKDLLVAEPEFMLSTIPGESRREAIGRVARYGAAAAAGSMVVSATAATPAMAASGQCCQCVNQLNIHCECKAIIDCSQTSEKECLEFCEKSTKPECEKSAGKVRGFCEIDKACSNGVSCVA
jgi:hypothetical protein